MKEIDFDKIFILDDKKHLVVYQEYQNFRQPDESIKPQKVDSIMLITANENKFKTSDPDGAERDYWLNKIGVLSEDDFQASAKKLQLKEDRKKLYDLLDDEQGRESAKKLKADKLSLQQEIAGLEGRLRKKEANE